MKLWLERFGYGDDSTLGRLMLDDDGALSHLCFTVEDERRDVKVPGETAIPVGVYAIELRTEGGLTQKYARRFPEMHKGMLWLQSVPGFDWIYLHIGNDDDDTEGCPLTVTTPFIDGNGEFTGGGSKDAYVKLYTRIVEAMEAGDDVVIKVSEK